MGSMTTSCEDMLSPDSERHSYSVAQDTLYSYWGIIKSLQNVAERYIVLGECRGELIDGTSYVRDTITNILNYDMDKAVDGSCRFLNASDYYHIINSCNAYLANCDKERTTGTLQPYMLKEAAQVEAIRAWTYLQLVQVYGEVPFYTEPLLTTDDISAFMANHPTATIDNLADLLAPGLIQAEQIETQYGMPQYETYQGVCHSSKVMIPVDVILGDLYLAKGDPASCTEAAQYYYNYLSNHQDMGNITPGGTLPLTYTYGFKGEGQERPIYLYDGSAPWSQTDEVSASREAVTAIPSSTNKLWGSVLRGVNSLYGYDSQISVHTESTSDTTSSTSASITLTAKYDVKQLAPSNAYFDLCKAQKFELVIASDASSAATQDSVTIDPEVGDARQYWVRDVNQTYSNGLQNTEKFIKKINPTGSDNRPNFSTVSHMIYRKSMIWLRFAEALNRAGYPSHAFAILKNGLCNNENWFPEAEPRIRDNNFVIDYTVTKQAWVFFSVVPDSSVVPVKLDSLLYPGGDTISGKPRNELIRMFIYKMGQNNQITQSKDTEAELDAYLAQQVTDSLMTPEQVAAGVKLSVPLTFSNVPDSSCSQVLYYIDRREVLKNPSFLNFEFISLNGNSATETYFWRTSLTERSFSTSMRSVTGNKPVTYGIHSHGCGMLLPSSQRSSSYNYVDLITHLADSVYHVTLTPEDIYSGNYDDVVQNCVEDLIVDEEALELAFEGTRFFDLLRVAHRRNQPSYLADRVGKRNPALQSKLLNPKNWYFPLP